MQIPVNSAGYLNDSRVASHGNEEWYKLRRTCNTVQRDYQQKRFVTVKQELQIVSVV